MQLAARKLNHIDTLDGVRGVAILLVLIWHYFTIPTESAIGGVTHYIQNLTGFTWSGVDLFFVLSGFLIGRIILIEGRNKDFFKHFLIRRAARIFPAYYLSFFLFLFARSVLHQYTFDWLFATNKSLWPYIFFLQNFFMKNGLGPGWLAMTWSLAVEQQFYLIMAFLPFFLKRKHYPYLISCGIMLAAILRVYLPGYLPCVIVFARMDAFLAGLLVAYLYLKKDLWKYFEQSTQVIFVLLFFMFFFIILMTSKQGWGDVNGIVNHSFFALFYGLALILAIATPKGLVKSALTLKPLKFLGRISYGVYLYHQMIDGLFHGFLRHQQPLILDGFDLVITLLSLATTILVATLSFYTLESWFLNRFRHKR